MFWWNHIKLKIGGYYRFNKLGMANRVGRLIKIIDGALFRNGRISNFWDWKEVLPNGELSEKREYGYGGSKYTFFPITEDEAIELAQSIERSRLAEERRK